MGPTPPVGVSGRVMAEGRIGRWGAWAVRASGGVCPIPTPASAPSLSGAHQCPLPWEARGGGGPGEGTGSGGRAGAPGGGRGLSGAAQPPGGRGSFGDPQPKPCHLRPGPLPTPQSHGVQPSSHRCPGRGCPNPEDPAEDRVLKQMLRMGPKGWAALQASSQASRLAPSRVPRKGRQQRQARPWVRKWLQ